MMPQVARNAKPVATLVGRPGSDGNALDAAGLKLLEHFADMGYGLANHRGMQVVWSSAH